MGPVSRRVKGFLFRSFPRISQPFERKVVYRTRNTMRLCMPLCRFLLDDGCSIHWAKPTPCRIFPFWPELVDKPSGMEEDRALVPGTGMPPDSD
jgi:Fe-S-cluster containining protein